jgi:pyrimidine-nucleoside phosphorylase
VVFLRAYDIILKKRNGNKLSQKEIDFFIQGYVNGSIRDYQAAAWTMAVYFNGLDREETANLTLSMINSGEKINLESIQGIKVDKHSTGGVGDKTTLVLVPLAAAAGVSVAKMSGRGLGFTGGTLDKLESIPGFNISLDKEKFLDTVKQIGCSIAGQTGNLVPADKKLYSLRDVTATIDIVPLIASSVMSKKIASGADKIVLDVKTGKGSFMKKTEDAFKLAEIMVEIGTELEKETIAVISDMNQPLGCAVGNALEVKEAIKTLQGEGPEDFQELCIKLGSLMLLLAGKVKCIDEAELILQKIISRGKAVDKFFELVKMQNGDTKVFENLDLWCNSPVKAEVKLQEEGFIHQIDAEIIGNIVMHLGAGREKKEDKIDHKVGIVLNKKNGDSIKKGEIAAVVHAKNESDAEEAVNKIKDTFVIKTEKSSSVKLIHGYVDKNGKSD